MGRGHILRKISNSGGAFRQLIDGEVTVDSKGDFVKTKFAPIGSSLLASFLVKGGQVAPLPQQLKKRPRGRPGKDVAALAAEVWDDVTGGAGVVLADGEPVEVPKALK